MAKKPSSRQETVSNTTTSVMMQLGGFLLPESPLYTPFAKLVEKLIKAKARTPGARQDAPATVSPLIETANKKLADALVLMHYLYPPDTHPAPHATWEGFDPVMPMLESAFALGEAPETVLQRLRAHKNIGDAEYKRVARLPHIARMVAGINMLADLSITNTQSRETGLM